MSVFILAQYHCQIVTEVRNQFDIVFMLSTSDKKSIVRIHSEYCSCVDLRMFKYILSYVTQGFGLLVIDNQSTSLSIDDVCFHSKIQTYPPTIDRLGSNEMWEFGEDHFCDEDQSRPGEEDAEEWVKTKDPGCKKMNHVITDRCGKLIIRML